LNKLECGYSIKESFNTHMPNNPAKIFRNNPPKSSLQTGRSSGANALADLHIITLANSHIN